MGWCLVSSKECPPSRRHHGDASAAICFSEETCPMEQRISLITLGVTDLARSRHFYEHGLGWHPSSASHEQVTFFQTGGMILALYGKKALAQDAHLAPGGSGFGGIVLAYNVRQREEVDAVLAEAQAAGAILLTPAEDTD